MLHATIASAKSPFINAACNSRTKEAKEKVIRLPEVRPKTFESYIQWLYNDTVHIVVPDPSKDQEVNRSAALQAEYAKLYTLPSMLLDAGLQNQVVDNIKDTMLLHKTGPTNAVIKQIYEHGPAERTLQRYTIDWYASQCGEMGDFLQKH